MITVPEVETLFSCLLHASALATRAQLNFRSLQHPAATAAASLRTVRSKQERGLSSKNKLNFSGRWC